MQLILVYLFKHQEKGKADKIFVVGGIIEFYVPYCVVLPYCKNVVITRYIVGLCSTIPSIANSLNVNLQ